MNGARGRSPAQYGWLAGVGVGIAVLVIAPMVDSLDTSYLLPNHWKIAFVVGGVVSGFGAFALGRSWFKWALALAAGIMCAFMIRVVIDVIRDRTNHNLWPFELVLDFIGALPFTVGGAAVGWFTRRRADREAEQGTWTPRWKEPDR